MKKLYLTVNEFAAMHHVNKRTLHYYDEEGIFKPALVTEAGYRMYTYAQNGSFEIILALRELGMTIDEIKEYQKAKDPYMLAERMDEKAKEIEEKIEMLSAIHSLLSDKRKDLLLSLSDQTGKVDVVTLEPELIMLTDIRGIYEGKDMDDEVVKALSGHLKDGTKTFRPFNTAYGSVHDLDLIEKGDYARARYVFIKIKGVRNKEGLTVRPGGTYLRGFAKGLREGIPDAYERMKGYARENGIEITGDAFQEGVNEFGIMGHEDMKNFVMRILIPCRVPGRGNECPSPLHA